jgi:hypothetical protein
MLKSGAIALTGMLYAAPLASAGERLPIDGTFGNEAGCKLVLTGNYGEDDSAIILTQESLSTMVTYCSFTKIDAPPGSRFLVAMTCASEGSGPEDNYQDSADVSGDQDVGYSVRLKNGTEWGPLKRCD